MSKISDFHPHNDENTFLYAYLGEPYPEKSTRIASPFFQDFIHGLPGGGALLMILLLYGILSLFSS